MILKTINNKKISKFCLGTWALGGNANNNIAYGGINFKTCEKLLNFSYEKKINFFDTANVYGDSEKKNW